MKWFYTIAAAATVGDVYGQETGLIGLIAIPFVCWGVAKLKQKASSP